MRFKFAAVFIGLIVSSCFSWSVETPKNRAVDIKSITANVIHINYGRSVKLVFPWALDEYEKELPFHIDLADTDVFTYNYVPGQNFVRISYSSKGDYAGEVVDLHINSHGYHFTLALESVSSIKKHFSLIVFNLSDADKIGFLARERSKISHSLQEKYNKKIANFDQSVKKEALILVGKLASTKPKKISIYREFTLYDELDNSITLFVDRAKKYADIWVFPFEIKNKTTQNISLSNLRFLQKLEETEQPIEMQFKLPPVVKSNSSVKGFVVTSDKRFNKSYNTFLLITTGIADLEVAW
jgi:hypothetical protein